MYFATATALGFQTPPHPFVGAELSYESLNASLLRRQMVIKYHTVSPSRQGYRALRLISQFPLSVSQSKIMLANVTAEPVSGVKA